MTSIFSDEQRASLMDSMTNPESNARKMIEQNAEIGISPDVTTEILNKYATYGANTGIGNIGGGKLVDALNERYRNRVDAPLRASNGTPSGVGAAAGLDANFAQTLEELRRLQEQSLVENTLSADATEAELRSMGDALDLETTTREMLNAEGRKQIDEFGSSLPDQDIASPVDLEGIDVESKLEQLRRYLENNPVVAQQLGKSLGTGLGIAAKAAVGEDDTPRTRS